MSLPPDTFRQLSVALFAALVAALALAVGGCPSREPKPTPKAMPVDPALTRPNGIQPTQTTTTTASPASSDYGGTGPSGYAPPMARPIPFNSDGPSSNTYRKAASAVTHDYSAEQKEYFESLTKTASVPIPPESLKNPSVSFVMEKSYTKAPDRTTGTPDIITKEPPEPKKANASTGATVVGQK